MHVQFVRPTSDEALAAEVVPTVIPREIVFVRCILYRHDSIIF